MKAWKTINDNDGIKDQYVLRSSIITSHISISRISRDTRANKILYAKELYYKFIDRRALKGEVQREIANYFK